MSTTKTKQETKQQTKETIQIFGDTIENRKYELKEVVALTRKRFETNGKSSELPVGNMSYYILAFRHLKLVEVSYETLAQVIRKIFELNNQITNTTAKSQAWYQRQIKSGKINIHENFKNPTKTKHIIDISTLF